jgi:hypothetical protein
MDEQNARLRQLRAAHFYYVAEDVPLNIWPEPDGSRYDFRDMSIEHLERCILKVQADITTLSFPIAAEDPDERYHELALEKVHALLLVFLCKV